MKLELSQSLQQQQILAPQMILSMDILLLPSLDLEQRIREEFAENPALELVEREAEPRAESTRPEPTTESSAEFTRLEAAGEQGLFTPDYLRKRSSATEKDSKHEALQNTEGRPPGLRDTLTEQVHLRALADDVRATAEDIIGNLDHRGYLYCSIAELEEVMTEHVSADVFREAMHTVRDLDPAGVGAEDLVDCLLLQLDRDRQDYPLEKEIISRHLQDLGLNKIPKIAKDLGKTVDEIKDAVEIIASLDPIPGGRIEPSTPIYVRPDIYIEVVDDDIQVRIDGGNIPDLQVSDSCRGILSTSRGNREVTDFVRKKIESAQWLIQAVQQRKRTLQEIAIELAKYQREFMFHGPEKLRALKMQTIADLVGVHISTISRAIKGKYVQTPYGLYELRYFFTGGVEGQDGELESRRNIYRKISELIEAEDKSRPHSDTALTRLLQEQGLKIARRTVTKYREQEGIPSSRLRREY